MKRGLLLLTALFVGVSALFAQPIYNEAGIRLYHTPSQEEIEWAEANNIKAVTVPTPPPVGELRPIAEYEPAEAVLISYPYVFGIPMSLIKEMSKDAKVITIVSSTSQQNTVQNLYTSNGVNIANCKFLVAATDSYWTRDFGPWFMAIDNREVAIYDFTYNRNRPNDNQINSKLAPFLSNDGVQINRYASTIVHAGGNFMNDGASQAASTILPFTENPTWTEQQLKEHYLEYMGIEEYHFLNDPLGAYIQHIDCWGKYLAPNKVMIGQVPTSDLRYQFYEAAANHFASLTSPWGTPMQVYRVYTPGGYQTTPYTNSLILNNKVFVPLSGSSNDAAAIQAYKDAMPGYEVFGITYNYWENTDALHCRTHEIADRCMLYIKHQPLFGEIENGGAITFATELYSYCEHTVYEDSVIVYVRANGGEYEGYNMLPVADNTWEVTVSGLPNGLIEYYVFAADQSGRRECHPYIGAPDPHRFTLINAIPTPVLSLDKTSSSVTLDGVTVVEDNIAISNLGNADLLFEIANIDFPAAKLTVTPDAGTIPPAASQTITLTYDFGTAKNEEFTGSFILKSNDPLQQEVEISLCATIVVGINDIKNSTLTIYPNPATKVINIHYPDIQPTKAYIYNLLGTPIKETTLAKGINVIYIQDMPAGIYFIRINAEAYKLIKQ
jgi:agmatine/peptidylarginine deiminase